MKEKTEIRCAIIQTLDQCVYATLGSGHFGCKFNGVCEGQRPKQHINITKCSTCQLDKIFMSNCFDCMSHVFEKRNEPDE